MNTIYKYLIIFWTLFPILLCAQEKQTQWFTEFRTAEEEENDEWHNKITTVDTLENHIIQLVTSQEKDGFLQWVCLQIADRITGEFVQTIDLSTHESLGHEWIISGDFNFDGYNDFNIIANASGTNSWGYYFLYDKETGKFVESEELSGLSSLEFTPDKTIIERIALDNAAYENEYRYIDNQLTLIASDSSFWDPASNELYFFYERIDSDNLDTHDQEEFHFPIIHSPDKLVEEKINILLQLGELDLIKGKEKKNIFERITDNNGTIYGGKVSIEFQILANTERNLAIKFDESSCGATCAYWVNYYNFNPQNGDKYALQDFFTNSDFIAFKNYISPIRQQEIKAQIEQLKKTGENFEYLEEYLYSSIAEDDLDEFYFTSDSIFFDIENLLNKYDKSLGLDNLTGISIKSIQHLLNDFGKSVLLTGENLKDLRSLTEPQLYEGVLDDKSHFYLLFKNSDENNFIGVYAYKKYGKAIPLKGKLEDNHFLFKELNKNYDEVATLVFEKEGIQLTGYWQDLKGNKLTLSARRK